MSQLVGSRGLVGAAVGVWMIFVSCDNPDQSTQPEQRSRDPEPPEAGLILEANRDGREVFKRAFWQEPSAEDEIIHAERREWTGEERGVRRWSWFLQVAPAVDVPAWIEEELRFSLRTMEFSQIEERWPEEAPSWFPSRGDAEGMTIARAPRSSLVLLYADGGDQFFAFDSGGGFQKPGS